LAQGNDEHARYATRLVYGRLADVLEATGDKAGAGAARGAMAAFEGEMGDDLESLSPEVSVRPILSTHVFMINKYIIYSPVARLYFHRMRISLVHATKIEW
jgi:hypothetical protein